MYYNSHLIITRNSGRALIQNNQLSFMSLIRRITSTQITSLHISDICQAMWQKSRHVWCKLSCHVSSITSCFISRFVLCVMLCKIYKSLFCLNWRIWHHISLSQCEMISDNCGVTLSIYPYRASWKICLTRSRIRFLSWLVRFFSLNGVDIYTQNNTTNTF